MEPGLRVLVSATENGDLIVYRHELDWSCPHPHAIGQPCLLGWLYMHGAIRTVAIPFLPGRIQRLGLVLSGIPEYLEVLLRAVSFGVECPVHLVYDFLVRAALEGDHLSLVVETKIKV